jgi:hypothetical protein
MLRAQNMTSPNPKAYIPQPVFEGQTLRVTAMPKIWKRGVQARYDDLVPAEQQLVQKYLTGPGFLALLGGEVLDLETLLLGPHAPRPSCACTANVRATSSRVTRHVVEVDAVILGVVEHGVDERYVDERDVHDCIRTRLRHIVHRAADGFLLDFDDMEREGDTVVGSFEVRFSKRPVGNMHADRRL